MLNIKIISWALGLWGAVTFVAEIRNTAQKKINLLPPSLNQHKTHRHGH